MKRAKLFKLAVNPNFPAGNGCRGALCDCGLCLCCRRGSLIQSMKTTIHANGRLTGETATCGYGERLVIRFECPLPHFRNHGYNEFWAENFDLVQLDAFPDAAHPSNDSNADQKADGRFMGWVKAMFTNGETWCFIYPAHCAYDATLHRFTVPIYTIKG